MKAVAAQNARVVDPVYHVILSWPEGEQPADAQAFACGEHALDSLGMAGHQYVFAIHRDTRNIHMHMAVNRVHPESFKTADRSRDYFKLDRAMRELELRFGWKHDKGPFAVFMRDGKSVVDWVSTAPSTKGRIPALARDMERHGNQESLFSYARGASRSAVRMALKNPTLTWSLLHSMLADHGLRLVEKGRGLAVCAATDDTNTISGPFVKASDVHEDLSKGRLTARLGPFEPAPLQSAVTPVEQYDRFRSPLRDADIRAGRRQERADARRALRARFDAFRHALTKELIDTEAVKARYRAIRATAMQRRRNVRLQFPERSARKAQYSVIAFETAREIQRLREQVRAERRAVRMRNDQARMSYRTWVEREAALGDAAALAQLRGWASAAGRNDVKSKALGSDDGGFVRAARGFRVDTDADRAASGDIPGVGLSVCRDGSVRYQLDNGSGGFVDRGDFIEVDARTGRAPCLAALQFAVHNFGQSFTVEGEPQFVQEVNNLRVNFPTADELQRERDMVPADPDQIRRGTSAYRVKQDRV